MPKAGAGEPWGSADAPCALERDVGGAPHDDPALRRGEAPGRVIPAVLIHLREVPRVHPPQGLGGKP